jgi:hypothetical protein
MEYEKSMVVLTAKKLESSYGERKKREDREHKDQQALIFARALISVGGTFEFTDDHKKIGYSTIFEAMAADLHEVGANMKKKIQNGEEFEHVYRNGCSALNSKLIQEWDSFIVYSIPRNVDDKSIQVITMNGDMVVNAKGQTAMEINSEREKKRTSGQMMSSAKKLTRSVGQEKALAALSGIVSKVEQMVNLPRGSRMGELEQSAENTLPN